MNMESGKNAASAAQVLVFHSDIKRAPGARVSNFFTGPGTCCCPGSQGGVHGSPDWTHRVLEVTEAVRQASRLAIQTVKRSRLLAEERSRAGYVKLAFHVVRVASAAVAYLVRIARDSGIDTSTGVLTHVAFALQTLVEDMTPYLNPCPEGVAVVPLVGPEYAKDRGTPAVVVPSPAMFVAGLSRTDREHVAKHACVFTVPRFLVDVTAPPGHLCVRRQS